MYVSKRGLASFLLAALLAGCDKSEPMAVGETAWDRVQLISEAAEPIAEIVVREGDTVARGDLILRQLPEMTTARLEQAAASRDQARARLAEIRRGPRQQRIDEARALLDGAESRLHNQREQLHRVEELVARGLASTADLDRARADTDSARGEVNALRAELNALLEGSTVEELQQAEAAYQQAEARWQEIQVTLNRLAITAPRNGIIDALPYEAGERPAAGSVVVVMLVGKQPHARVYIPEAQRVHIRPGTSLPIKVDGISDSLTGRVRYVASDPAFTPFYALTEHDRSRLSYLAEIDFENLGDHQLPAGIPVQVDLSGLGDD